MAALPWWQRRELVILATASLLVLGGLYIWPDRAAALDELLHPLAAAFSRARFAAESVVRDVTDWRAVQRENRELRARAAALQAERTQQLELLAENRRLQRLVGMKPPPGYTSLTARVIGHNPDNWRRALLVDQGTSSGVKKNAVALSADGLVGRVIKTTRWTSQVLLVADATSHISCLNARTRARGVVQGQNHQPAILTFPSARGEFEEGDLLVTSGLGGVFPKGIPIGAVSRLLKDTRDPSKAIEVAFLPDLDHLEEVVLLLRP